MIWELNRASNKSIDYPGVVKKEKWGLYPYTINLDSFSDFEKLESAFGSDLIVSFRDRRITIYDSYVE